MVVLAKPKKLICSFREDEHIVELLKLSKGIKTKYRLFSKELGLFSVGAPKQLGTPDDFENAVERMQRVQEYLNRIEEMRKYLLGAKTELTSLYQTGSIHISEFHHIQKVRTSSQRDSWVDEVLLPISSKIDKINELLEVLEAKMWNLKHCHSVIVAQVDCAKMVWYMRNPFKHLEGRVK